MNEVYPGLMSFDARVRRCMAVWYVWCKAQGEMVEHMSSERECGGDGMTGWRCMRSQARDQGGGTN